MALSSGFTFRFLLGVILAPFFAIWLYGRLVAVPQVLIYNAPDRLIPVNGFKEYSVKFTDQVRNCEDGIVVPDNKVAILSCDPGRDLWNTVMGIFTEPLTAIPHGQLFLYQYGSQKLSDEEAVVPIELVEFPEISSFHPLGIDYHQPSGTLFVCNHAYEGARIEVFSLDISANRPVATHKRTIVSPLLRTPNAIAALNDHEFYVTNDHYFRAKDFRWLALLESYGAIPGGSLAHVNLSPGNGGANGGDLEVRTVSRIPFANGVTLLNESRIAVASTTTPSVNLYDILPDRSVRLSGTIKVSFLPDNLSTDDRGVLLIAGHPHAPSMEKLIHSRLECVRAGGQDLSQCHRASSSPSWVAEWTELGGLKNLYVSRSEYGTSTTAARDASNKFGIITGLYEKGILVWKE